MPHAEMGLRVNSQRAPVTYTTKYVVKKRKQKTNVSKKKHQPQQHVRKKKTKPKTKNAKKSAKRNISSAPAGDTPLSYIFDVNRDDGKLPYHLAGDLSLYSKENLRKRRALRRNPQVIERIQRFGELYNKDEFGRISKDEYLRMHLKIAQVLHPKRHIEDLKRIGYKDWRHDSKGKKFLDPEDFIDSIFEMVDLWCRTVELSEYLIFLDSLYIKVKYQGAQDPNAYSILL